MVLVRDTVTPKLLVDPAVLPGNERIASICIESVKCNKYFSVKIFQIYIAETVLLNLLVSFYLYYCYIRY